MRTDNYIRIGGDLPTNLLPAFHNAIEAEGAGFEWDGPVPSIDDIRETIEAGEFDRLVNPRDQGYMNTIRAFCQEHNLSYIVIGEESLETDRTMLWWKPGMNEPARSTATLNEYTTIEVREIQSIVDDIGAHFSADDAIAEIRNKIASTTPPELPPLTLTA